MGAVVTCAALCGRRAVQSLCITHKRVATEGHPYSCALRNLAFDTAGLTQTTKLNW